MDELFLSDAKYTCRGCLLIDKNLATMTWDEISAYQSYVKVEGSNSIMKICYICRYMLQKFKKFITQCQKSNDVLNSYLEENQIINVPNCKFNTYVTTTPVLHYFVPDSEFKLGCTYDDIEDCDAVDRHDVKPDEAGHDDDDDMDDVPLVMLQSEVDGGVKVKKKKKKRKESKDTKNRKKEKVKKQLKEGFSSRMVQETNEYEVIKLTKEQVLQEMEEKRKCEKYERSLYKCHQCVKGFNFKDVIESHMKKHTQENGILKCEICGFYCPSAVSLRGHMKSHTTRYKCKICGAVRISRQHLLEHYSIEHTDDATTYKCEECPFTTKKRTVIQRHVRGHRGVNKSLTCTVCDRRFKNVHTYRLHASRHDPTKLVSCTKCNLQFVYPSLLQKHMLYHSQRDFYCVECDVTFKTINNLNLHYKRTKKHRDPSTFKFKCSQCEERFISPSSVVAHLSTAHGAPKPLACPHCGQLYSSRASVKSHIKRKHEAQRFSCDVCDKEFTRKNVLVKHLRTHKDTTTHGCCGGYDQPPVKPKKQEDSMNETTQNTPH